MESGHEVGIAILNLKILFILLFNYMDLKKFVTIIFLNHMFKGHNHNWGTQKECLTQNQFQDIILSDHYVYQIIYFGEFIFSLDTHILCD
jgi:hypothetical protein